MQNKLHVCLQIHNILILFLQIRGANTLYIYTYREKLKRKNMLVGRRFIVG